MQNKENCIDYQQLTDQTLSAIFILNRDKTIYYFNQTALTLLDCTSEQLSFKNFDEFLHPDYHEICKKRLQSLFEFQQSAQVMDQKLFTYDKQVIDVEVKAVPYYSSDGVLALVFIRDITKQKQAERLLAHRDKLGAIGQISAGIAHEIRNPLTAVKGFVQLIKEDTNHVYIDPIETELDKALATLNNLLQVSKPDLQSESKTVFNLCQELDSITYLFQEKQYNIEIKKRFQDCEMMILGKKNTIIKCFFNLVKNAIEAIEEQGEIIIEHYYSDGYLNVKIADSGIGISPEHISLLGTPFYSTKDSGTGMGLTQVFTTIQDHNGQIHIDSKKGEGTTFHITLPVR